MRTPNGTQVEDATLRSSTDLIVFRSRGYGAPGELRVAPPPAAGDSVRQARPFVATDADDETPRLSPDGTPDGRGLYFRGESRMHFVALTSGATLVVVRRDTLFADPYRRAGVDVPYDVFPDGQTLLMQKAVGTGRAPIVVLNWPGLLRRGAVKR